MTDQGFKEHQQRESRIAHLKQVMGVKMVNMLNCTMCGYLDDDDFCCAFSDIRIHIETPAATCCKLIVRGEA